MVTNNNISVCSTKQYHIQWKRGKIRHGIPVRPCTKISTTHESWDAACENWQNHP